MGVSVPAWSMRNNVIAIRVRVCVIYMCRPQDCAALDSVVQSYNDGANSEYGAMLREPTIIVQEHRDALAGCLGLELLEVLQQRRMLRLHGLTDQ